MKKKIVLKAIYGVISAALLTGMIVLDNLYLTFETSIVANLCPPKVDQSASNVSTSAGKELAEKMELEAFNRQVMPMLDIISENTRENQQLTSLRDWLLPMLMNGQATIND